MIQKLVETLKLKQASVAAALLLLSFSQAHAREFGAGIFLGEPTGLTGKYWMSDQNAIDVKLAWSFNSYFLVTGDYLWHFPGAFGRKSEFVSQLSPYIGPGAAMIFGKSKGIKGSDAFAIGLRFPLGIEWLAPTIPLGIFLELAPGLTLAPSTDGYFMGGVGARFYFE